MRRTSRQRASLSPAFRLVLLGGMLAPPSPADILWVGSGCTHGNIFSAILEARLTPGPDEIRVVRDQPYTEQMFELRGDPKGFSLTIAGGYDTCSDLAPSGKTELVGTVGFPVILVNSDFGLSEVTLRDLSIRDSSEEGVLVEGAMVTFESVSVFSNGGRGVVVDGSSVYLDVASEVHENDGGGISCSHGHVEVAAWVHDNSGVDGGGIALDQCELYVRSQARIAHNDATSGGGIYALHTWVDIDGTDPGFFATQIDGNTASGSGGGIFATGAGTTVTIRNASVTSNTAVNQGGGIVAWQGASMVMERVNGGCHDEARCSNLSGNSLTSGYLGAAAWAGTGATLTISQTYVDGNSIPIASPIGNVLYATGTGTTLNVEGVGMWNNQGPSLIEGFDSAVVHVAFVSATGNVYGETELPARPIALGNGATGTLGSSIFYPNSPAIGASALSELDCLIVSNTGGLSTGDFITVADPLFLNPAEGDLHLPPNSPAVDYCDDFVTVPQHADIDREVRGFDLAANPDGEPGVGGGAFDIGFDENRGLFIDGFESETTGAWSLTVP